jgi:hypothetical protein
LTGTRSRGTPPPLDRQPPTFVFAVCGAAVEIQTLNVALRYLRRFSTSRIRVVTDLARNEASIAHDDLVDHRTPATLSHRQAAMFLKTGLHRILPMPGPYCYLDGDVIAVRPGVDEVFAHKQASITFATDQCRLPEFSGYAVRCRCLAQREAEIARLWGERVRVIARIARKWDSLQQVIARFEVCPAELAADRARLRDGVRAYWRGWEKARRWGCSWRRYVRRRGTLPEMVASLGYTWNETEHAGYDAQGRLVWAENTVASVERLTGCRHDPTTGRWVDPEGDVLDTALVDVSAIDAEIERLRRKGCDHLRQAIRARFGVDVTDPSWRHWNSGVFVFDEGDAELFELWHQWSMALIGDPYWETRDQGALVAAVWKLGLERQRNLPIQFNFIADYYQSALRFDERRGFSFEGREEFIQPFLVHIFHHFGDRSWPVWQWIEAIEGSESAARQGSGRARAR